MNLAGNAIKFTKRGRVEIGVELVGSELIYRVSDTGIGIPKDELENVFAEFRQVDATVTREFGGTGLGLSITKKFVEMHGGRIWIESEIGKGCTFFFAVPLADERRWRMSENTILYVEDNEYNRKIVRVSCSAALRTGLIEAVDGEAGVALAQQELPDLILMDVQLPKMSGLDATTSPEGGRAHEPHPDHRDYVVRAERRSGKGGRRPAPTATSRSRTARASFWRWFASIFRTLILSNRR